MSREQEIKLELFNILERAAEAQYGEIALIGGHTVLRRDAEHFKTLNDELKSIESGKKETPKVEEQPVQSEEPKVEEPKQVNGSVSYQKWENNMHIIEANIEKIDAQMKSLNPTDQAQMQSYQEARDKELSNLNLHKLLLLTYNDTVTNLSLIRSLHELEAKITDPELKDQVTREINNRGKAVQQNRQFITPKVMDEISAMLNTNSYSINDDVRTLWSQSEEIQLQSKIMTDSNRALTGFLYTKNSSEALPIYEQTADVKELIRQANAGIEEETYKTQKANVAMLLNQAIISDIYYSSSLFDLKNDAKDIGEELGNVAKVRVEMLNATKENVARELSFKSSSNEILSPASEATEKVELESNAKTSVEPVEPTATAPAPSISLNDTSIPFKEAGLPPKEEESFEQVLPSTNPAKDEEPFDLLQNATIVTEQQKNRITVREIKDASLELVSKLPPMKIAKEFVMRVRDYVGAIKNAIVDTHDLHSNPIQVEYMDDGSFHVVDRRTDAPTSSERNVEIPPVEVNSYDTEREDLQTFSYNELFDLYKEYSQEPTEDARIHDAYVCLKAFTLLAKPMETVDEFERRCGKLAAMDKRQLVEIDAQDTRPDIEENTPFSKADGVSLAYIPEEVYHDLSERRQQAVEAQAVAK